MTQETEIREIPLTDLVISKGQVRVRDVGVEIEELAESIRKMGLLEPIVVCPAETAGKYEILTGQRRFLAHKYLQRATILATVRPRVDDATAKALSLTENLVRRDLTTRDLIDACTSLYKRYGTIEDVVAETGLPRSKVKDYVKYDRLAPEMRKLVDDGRVNIATALRATDAVAAIGKSEADAVKLALEMSSMSGAQQQKVAKAWVEDPSQSVDDAIEQAKTGGRIVQVMVTLGSEVHHSLQSFAKEEGTTQDSAAADLIAEGLKTKGYLND
jgi:ParB family chromosome partitioning protein